MSSVSSSSSLPSTASSSSSSSSTAGVSTTVKTSNGRYAFLHQGNTVYEYEQSLDDVILYINPPPGARAVHIDCKITPNHLRIGIKNNPPYLDVRLKVFE